MHLHEEPDPSVRQAGQEPHLPQRPGSVQLSPPELLTRREELLLVARRRHRNDPDVLRDVEGRGISPHGPSQPRPQPVQDLAEAWGEVQPPVDALTDRIDQELTMRIEE